MGFTCVCIETFDDFPCDRTAFSSADWINPELLAVFASTRTGCLPTLNIPCCPTGSANRNPLALRGSRWATHFRSLVSRIHASPTASSSAPLPSCLHRADASQGDGVDTGCAAPQLDALRWIDREPGLQDDAQCFEKRLDARSGRTVLRVVFRRAKCEAWSPMLNGMALTVSMA